MDKAAHHDVPGAFVDLTRGSMAWRATRSAGRVCVHGFTTPSYVYHSLAAGLGEMGFRVLVCDHFGRG